MYVANSNFYNVWGVKRIGIDIGNSGTTDMSILRLYIGSSASTLENQTITATTLNHGEIVRLTVTYDWTGDSTYFFKVISASGQSLAWSEQAPADEREEISITNMAFQTGTPGSILVVANNTGTSSVTINEIWVNNQKQNTISPTIPTKDRKSVV